MDTQQLEKHYDTLVGALRTFMQSTTFSDVILGLSGGIDSALCAAIAADALGPTHVHGVLMPSPFTSAQSVADAWDLANRLSIQTSTVPISNTLEILKHEIEETTLTPVKDVAFENLQARLRGVILMTLSNARNHLVLSTSNKSEIMVGYSTLYGDTVGAFAPLAATYKTEVFALAKWRNTRGEVIPPSSIKRPPSAELAENQRDDDALPPYDILDEVLRRYVDQKQSAADIIDAGFAEQLVGSVVALVKASAYKRQQLPPGPLARESFPENTSRS